MADGDFFVDVDIETSGQQLADEAVERLQTVWPDWEPNDGDLEVVQIETLAPMAENAAEVAAIMPAAALRAYGEKLIGRPYGLGAPATTTLTFTSQDDTGWVIPQGTEVDVDGFAFTTDVETVVPAGSIAVSGVTVASNEFTEEANGLTGENVSPLSGLVGIELIEVDVPTANGEDPETDEDYQNSLSRDLQLQAKTLVTTRDFEMWATSTAGVARAHAANNGDRAVEVVMVDELGQPVTTTIKDALEADFDQYRLVNTVLTIADPTYTTIDVAYTVKAAPGFDPDALETQINSMLVELLSPINWGTLPGGVHETWLNQPIVREHVLIDKIGNIEGVEYVTSVSITGSAGSASGADWTMAGDYPLPLPGTMTGTIT